MSVSEKQLAANRLNAQKSTGPKTEEGKARSRNNATVHGLRSDQTVIHSPHLHEDQAAFDRLLKSLIEEFKPDSESQKRQVHRIAVCMWRLERLAIAETAQIERQLNSVNRDYHTESSLNAFHIKRNPDSADGPLAFPDNDTRIETLKRSRLLLDERSSRNLLRYEMRTDRSLLRAIQILREMKGFGKHDNPRLASPNSKSPRSSTPHSAGDSDEIRTIFTL